MLYLALITAFGVGIRLVPFLRSAHPLGYDVGFYRRHFIEPTEAFFGAPAVGVENSPVVRFVLDLLRLFPGSPDIALYGVHILFWALAGIMFFFLVRHYAGERTAFIATALFTLSTAQYEAYTFFLLKNAAALSLLFVAFLLIEKRTWLAIIPALLLMATHRTTAIIFILTLAVYTLLNFKRSRDLLVIGAAASTFFFYLNFDIIPRALSARGIFLGWPEFLFFSAPLILFAVFGVREFWSTHRYSMISALGLVAGVFVFFKLTFYERIFIFFDIAIIFIAAHGVVFLAARASRVHRLALAIFSGIFLGMFSLHMQSSRPPFSADLFDMMRIAESTVPNNASILTAPQFAPLVYGWTTTRVIAPGLLYDTQSKESWRRYWASHRAEEKIEFLNNFPSPLYIFADQSMYEAFVPNTACVKHIAENFYHADCFSAKN